MDWLLFFTAAMAIVAVLTPLGVIYSFIRKNDHTLFNTRIDAVERKITNQDITITRKLDESEFRRFEERNEKITQNILDRTDARIDKLEARLEEQFDRLFTMLTKR